MVRQIKKLRFVLVPLLSTAVLAVLLAGCGRPSQGDRTEDKTYVIVVGDRERSVFSALDRIPGELDALLGDGWDKMSQPVIIICH